MVSDENLVKIAQCKCNDCPKEFNMFTISFKKNVPPWHIMCPVCGSENITIHWIDKSGINNNDE